MRLGLVGLSLCVGCGLTLELEPREDGGGGVDFGVDRRDLGARDQGTTDLSNPPEDLGGDGGSIEGDADTCRTRPELCNGLDDDCDGSFDEDYDLSRDLTNCGSCGTVCEGRGGAPICELGRCLIDCDPGRADCDGELANGCETDLTNAATCGTCDRMCPTSAPRCVSSSGAFTCASDCLPGQALCDGACVDLESSRSHCGGCGNACFVDPHGRVDCNGGICEVDSCGDGFADCNDDASDGCEQSLSTADHCGRCGASCESGTTCVLRACVASGT